MEEALHGRALREAYEGRRKLLVCSNGKLYRSREALYVEEMKNLTIIAYRLTLLALSSCIVDSSGATVLLESRVLFAVLC